MVICEISFFIISVGQLIYTETWEEVRNLKRKAERRFYLPQTLTAKYCWLSVSELLVKWNTDGIFQTSRI